MFSMRAKRTNSSRYGQRILFRDTKRLRSSIRAVPNPKANTATARQPQLRLRLKCQQLGTRALLALQPHVHPAFRERRNRYRELSSPPCEASTINSTPLDRAYPSKQVPLKSITTFTLFGFLSLKLKPGGPAMPVQVPIVCARAFGISGSSHQSQLIFKYSIFTRLAE